MSRSMSVVARHLVVPPKLLLVAVVIAAAAGCWLVRVWVRRLLTRAGTDPLTGLPGRAVAERLLDEVARSRRPVTVALAG